MSSTAFNLQGGSGGHVLNSGEGAQTGKTYRWIQIVEDTVFSNLAGNLTNIADLQTIPGLLKKRGYSQPEIEGIMAGNFINLLRKAWK
jgi:microsomal dipeptidase-like Zn-dependent dipeptidase